MLSKYLVYLKDNPEYYWFKRKIYGWGWTPATWQGWFVTLIVVAIIVVNFLRIDRASHSGSDTLINFIPQTALLLALLIAICYKKGEKPRWQWGFPSRDDSRLK